MNKDGRRDKERLSMIEDELDMILLLSKFILPLRATRAGDNRLRQVRTSRFDMMVVVLDIHFARSGVLYYYNLCCGDSEGMTMSVACGGGGGVKRWVWKWIRGDLGGYVGRRFSKFLDRAAKSVDGSNVDRMSKVATDDLDDRAREGGQRRRDTPRTA